MSHGLGLLEALALGRELGLRMPGDVILYALVVEDPFTFGGGMTPAVRAGVPIAADSILRQAFAG